MFEFFFGDGRIILSPNIFLLNSEHFFSSFIQKKVHFIKKMVVEKISQNTSVVMF